MHEIWKTTPEIQGYYEVSNLGRVRRTAPSRTHTSYVGKILKNHLVSRRAHGCVRQGYYVVSLTLPSTASTGRTTYVHRLVCEAFNGPPPENCEVSHKNNNSLDNSPDNLEWRTHTDNSQNSAEAHREATLRHYQGRR
jgi:hypothetical protein